MKTKALTTCKHTQLPRSTTSWYHLPQGLVIHFFSRFLGVREVNALARTSVQDNAIAHAVWQQWILTPDRLPNECLLGIEKKGTNYPAIWQLLETDTLSKWIFLTLYHNHLAGFISLLERDRLHRCITRSRFKRITWEKEYKALTHKTERQPVYTSLTTADWSVILIQMNLEAWLPYLWNHRAVLSPNQPTTHVKVEEKITDDRLIRHRTTPLSEAIRRENTLLIQEYNSWDLALEKVDLPRRLTSETRVEVLGAITSLCKTVDPLVALIDRLKDEKTAHALVNQAGLPTWEETEHGQTLHDYVRRRWPASIEVDRPPYVTDQSVISRILIACLAGLLSIMIAPMIALAHAIRCSVYLWRTFFWHHITLPPAKIDGIHLVYYTPLLLIGTVALTAWFFLCTLLLAPVCNLIAQIRAAWYYGTDALTQSACWQQQESRMQQQVIKLSSAEYCQSGTWKDAAKISSAAYYYLAFSICISIVITILVGVHIISPWKMIHHMIGLNIAHWKPIEYLALTSGVSLLGSLLVVALLIELPRQLFKACRTNANKTTPEIPIETHYQRLFSRQLIATTEQTDDSSAAVFSEVTSCAASIGTLEINITIQDLRS